MKTKAYLVAMSHLSDVQESQGSTSQEGMRMNSLKLNFVKWLVSKYKANMDIYIDPDKDFDEFKTEFPHLFKK